MTALTTLKNLMLGLLLALVGAAPAVAAIETYPPGHGTTVDGCQPVYVSNGEPTVEPDCIGPESSAAHVYSEDRPPQAPANPVG